MLEGFEVAARSLMKIVPLLVCANIIIALINTTGIGIKMSEMIMDIGKGNIFLGLILAGSVALVLGMGIPTVAAYLLASAVVAPALISMGIMPIAAHLFIFYYAILSALTPPVCAGVYIAAGIAQSDWLKTSWIAIRLALVKYILPFMFVYEYSLLLIGNPLRILTNLVPCIVGIIMLGGGTMGFFLRPLNIFNRGLLLAGALLLMKPGQLSNIAGLCILIIIILAQRGLPFRGKMRQIPNTKADHQEGLK